MTGLVKRCDSDVTELVPERVDRRKRPPNQAASSRADSVRAATVGALTLVAVRVFGATDRRGFSLPGITALRPGTPSEG